MTLWPTIAIDELRNLGIDGIQGYLIIVLALVVFLTFMVGVVVGVKTIAAWFMG
jgi:hypothetical protein